MFPVPSAWFTARLNVHSLNKPTNSELGRRKGIYVKKPNITTKGRGRKSVAQREDLDCREVGGTDGHMILECGQGWQDKVKKSESQAWDFKPKVTRARWPSWYLQRLTWWQRIRWSLGKENQEWENILVQESMGGIVSLCDSLMNTLQREHVPQYKQ